MLKIPNEIFFEVVIKTLRSGENVIIPMRGFSMLPYLKDGRDSVQLQPIDAQRLKRMDIVLFKLNNQYILHRFIGRKNGFLHMHGDGMLGKGEYCRSEDVYAKATVIITDHSKLTYTTSFHFRLKSNIWLLLRPLILHFKHLLKKARYNSI